MFHCSRELPTWEKGGNRGKKRELFSPSEKHDYLRIRHSGLCSSNIFFRFLTD